MNEVTLFAQTENASAVNMAKTFNTILNVSELILRYVTDSFFCSIRKSLKLFKQVYAECISMTFFNSTGGSKHSLLFHYFLKIRLVKLSEFLLKKIELTSMNK